MSDLIPEGTVVDGRYRVQRRLGTGGMADVYCAEDTQLGRNIALKLLHRRFASDVEFAERFRREAQAAAGLQHPNVVGVYDRGEWDGTSYIAMEFVDGRTLKQVIQQEGPLAPRRAVDLVEQVLKAAKFAHKRGIIHRDLKPHNVMVDAEDRVKVTDFGIAQAGASDMTQTGSIMGTAQYLSPEQAQGRPVSTASDTYAIGIMLFECLTGRVPFDGESAVAVALKQVNEAVVPPSHLVGSVPPVLDAIVLRAMDKDPSQRYPDADSFLVALEQAKPALPLSAGPILPPTSSTMIAPPTAEVAAAYVAAPVADPVEELEERDRRWWIALLVAALVVAAIIGGLLLFGKDRVTVPDVIGASQDAAEQRLSNEGLDSDSSIRQSERPEGTVISQDPDPGTKLEKGETVRIVVSGGPGTATVPPLSGRPFSQANETLQDLGFNVERQRQASADVGENRVISTEPAAGTELEKGETVVVVVSSGPERAEVPDVRNQQQDDATAALEDAGFEVRVREEERDDREAGTVLAQDPAGGTSRAKGSTVTITVAKEPEQRDVPDVVGQSSADAVEALSGAGFRVRTQTEQVDTAADDDTVLEQDPAGGQQLKPGQTVTIVVGRFDPDLNPDPQTDTTSTVTTP